jgi:hypothetical protein
MGKHFQRTGKLYIKYVKFLKEMIGSHPKITEEFHFHRLVLISFLEPLLGD